MSARGKLFAVKNIYDLPGTDVIFIAALRESLGFHIAHSAKYAAIAESEGFTPELLKDIGDIRRVPALPTMFMKKHSLFTVSEEKLVIRGTSSGTSGTPSRVGMDLNTAYLSLRMSLGTLSHKRLITPRPANYIILGYEPSGHNERGAAKSAYAMTLLAPALHREYALKDNGEDYALNLDGIRGALLRYEKSGHPVRFMGFPAYFLMMLKMMEAEGLRVSLPRGSKVFLHGGWKRFYTQKADKRILYSMSEELLGIGEEEFYDFYGPVEHPVIYADCPCHNFHVPAYSRVLIRDARSLEPAPFGTPGIINLISPLMRSMPAASIMPDDLAVMYDGRECPCGITSPFFKLLGRVGIDAIKTCAAEAGDLLGGARA